MASPAGSVRSGFRLGLAFVVLWFFAAVAMAEPAPRSDEELQADSDLIIEADILSVTKERTRWGPIWTARLHVRRTIKGQLPSPRFTYRFLPPPPGEIGGINESVFAGQKLRMFLIDDSGQGNFEAWASNSLEPLNHLPEDRWVLPRQYGETIYANGCRCFATPRRSACR